MKKRCAITVILCIMAIFFSACSKQSQIPEDFLFSLITGMTRESVEQVLGNPVETKMNSQGRLFCSYNLRVHGIDGRVTIQYTTYGGSVVIIPFKEYEYYDYNNTWGIPILKHISQIPVEWRASYKDKDDKSPKNRNDEAALKKWLEEKFGEKYWETYSVGIASSNTDDGECVHYVLITIYK